METIQQQIVALQVGAKRLKIAVITLASVIVVGGFVAATRPAGDATFDIITCKGWRVVDSDGKARITAGTEANGNAVVQWFDKDGKPRIGAMTFANGDASVAWLDKDGKQRITAATDADGDASVLWIDKDGKLRIIVATLADGTITLPTKDFKKP